MQIYKIYSLALTIIFGLAASGCAHTSYTGAADVDKQAFGARKKFAVVSIASMKKFQGEQGLGQLFTSNDNIPGMNTQPIINKLDKKIITTLGSSGYFTLLPENKVLSSKAYRSLPEDEKVMKVLFMSGSMNVANNYKYVSDEKKFAQLARELKVDGVIGITMYFSVTQGGGQVYLGPLNFGKKSYSAMASITAIAYNQDGKVIWKDSTMKEAEPGDTKAIVLIDTSNMTDTNFEKLHPSAVEIGGKAVDVLLARFDDTMAGKEVSGFQSVK